MTLVQRLKEKRVVILLGAGGVGKTTSSVAVALQSALQGRRVALLSIDPAQRLAAALGIELSGDLRSIDLKAHGIAAAGSLDAAMLDQKAVFDAMVRRHAPNPQIAFKILQHPVYQAASTKLIGPLEYMALAKLQDLAEDPRYDLIVLDTPPDTHALDFLARPNVLGGFFENKVMSWLIKPFLLAGKFGLGKMFSVGEKLMGGVAKVMGVTALHSFADFLVLIQEVLEGFNTSGDKVVKLLRKPETAFVLVTVPSRTAARSARNIAFQLKELGYRLEALLLNRCVPAKVAQDAQAAWGGSAGALMRRIAGQRAVEEGLVAAVGAPAVFRVDDFDGDLGDLKELVRLAGLY
jgi:anion-transporting  ArsA/GET3 family ATPase